MTAPSSVVSSSFASSGMPLSFSAAGAMVMACLDQCYFGARDTRQGCAESVYALTSDPAFYHRLPCVGGLLEAEAAALLRRFFDIRRPGGKGERA